MLDGVTPSLGQLQHWTRIVGLAQQTILERAAAMTGGHGAPPLNGTLEKIAEIQTESTQKGLALWQNLLADLAQGRPVNSPAAGDAAPASPDRRFRDPAWSDHPVYSVLRQSYLLLSESLLRSVDSIEGLDWQQRERARFAMQGLIDATSPANFPFTNPQVVQRTIETNGNNLLVGLERMMADLGRGQLQQTDLNAFTVGENIAVTPGKVIHETPLYQLIQYSPTTKTVQETPVIIFPPWINRFYILDLSPEKSFVRWAVDQGLTVFMVSWKSADAAMADTVWDDYVGAQVDAIDTVRGLLDVESVHAIGYCVAGTTLAATLAWLDAHGRQDIVKSATFFTAQVDFADSGDLRLFVDSQQIQMIDRLVTDGFLDGRYLAATFNLLRGNDLIWSYVVNNYLLADDYSPFDLLFWNGDTTNLPARWLRSYLEDLYRDNRLVQAGSLSVGGTPIDLRRVTVPAYIQAGVEDHIAPARSVWKLRGHLSGPSRFVLAGSGHIAGVVNPPVKQKYQYWTHDEPVGTFDEFRARATETKGSWWPDWAAWIAGLDPVQVPSAKARKPGKGRLPALEDAPGRYVLMR
ncbi:class I poly(R)-hydroxyalkanoic acid synthase [Sphingobium sufflavum]|uniref:PHA/PHB synthase family protein n=1 Tax=Sphingobium sufflavum TaxID=1129547 RepID=UPI001F2BB994|nr:class I poly(R)-hydroxyalkanoic acid synthase [Sphingobium sufflavum]MCE7795502.1 class I poly(R)-hydroxyalkanoic acid synthase [Sphingobium sufflavum]